MIDTDHESSAKAPGASNGRATHRRGRGETVLLLDDDPDALSASRSDLEAAGYRVEAYDSVTELLSRSDARRAAAAVVDLELPGESGIDAIVELSRRRADLPILCLTAHAAESYLFGALRAGAIGYVLKYDEGSIADAVRLAIDGGVPMTPSIARRVLLNLRGAGGDGAPHERQPCPPDGDALTERELDVLRMLSRGLTYAECGDVLQIRIDTVRAHVRHIYKKLHAATKAEAVMVAARRGWLE